ncbi:putative esterase YcpF (UPF0227 family) [Parabacteroides sp. PFB2-10]|nr:putative esterase YcpF (UPF0227 family) [Parabacteroides sp. PFB2-10]
MKKMIYIHGLSSSGNSQTVKTLRTLLPQCQVIAPDLPIDPQEALELLVSLCEKEKPNLIVGTSMGGLFAQQLHGFKKILVNPAFHVSETMRKRLGINPFLNKREDGSTEYEITEELCDAYLEMEQQQFDKITDYDKAFTWALFSKEDHLVNCLEEYRIYYNQFQLFDGEHRLSQSNIEEVLIPLIELATSIRTAVQRCEPFTVIFAKRKASLDDFVRHVEAGAKMDKIHAMRLLSDQYIDMCGISAGYRTVAYDTGWGILDEYIKSSENSVFDREKYITFAEIMLIINPRYREEFDDYDVLCIETLGFISVAFDMLLELKDDETKNALCYGLFLQMMNCYY